MKRRPLRFVLAVGILAAASPVAAEEKAPPDTLRYQVGEVVVTALRGHERLSSIPAASFVLSGRAIRQSGAARLSDLLQSLPGLYGYQQNANGDVGVVDPRGFTASGESSYLKLLVNGQDVRDVENGNVDWDWVFPEDVERVEVVEGAGAWAYGDGAEGGIVNVVRPAPAERFTSDCGARFGSFGLRSGGIAMSGQSGAWGGSLRGSARQVDGWRDHGREKVYSTGGGGRWKPGGDLHVSADAAWLDTDRQNPGTLTPDQIRADREQSETRTDFDHAKRLLLGARLAAGPEEDPRWTLAPYLRGENLDQVRTIFFQTKFHHTRALTGGATLDGRRAVTLGGRATALSAGVQAEESRLTSAYDDFDGTIGPEVAKAVSWRGTLAGYAGARIAIDPMTTARLSVRGDAARVRSEDRLAGTETASRTLSSVSPLAALSRRVGSSGSLYTSFSTAFRVPTLNQLFDRRPFFNPFTNSFIYLSNSRLSPQRSVGVEVGGRWDHSPRQSVLLALYSVRVRDEIDFDAGTFSYANLGRSWHRGVETALSQPLGSFLTLEANGTYSPTTIRGGGDDGNQINAVPLGTAYGSLKLSGPESWSLEGGVRYVGKQYLDKANQHRLPDFGTLELAGFARLRRLNVAIRASNLLDRKYADTGFFIDLTQEERLSPAPGRSFTVSLTLD